MMVVERYKDKDPLFVCLLRGGAPFATKLMFEITKVDPSFNPEMDYTIIKTYGNRREGTASELVTDLAPDTQAKDRWGARRTHQRFVPFLTKRPVPAILDTSRPGQVSTQIILVTARQQAIDVK